LQETEKNKGAMGTGANQYQEVQSHDVTTPPTLSDLGIKKMESSRLQTIASIPEENFEKHIAETKENHSEFTTVG